MDNSTPSNRIAIVTGSAVGIGHAIALRLAEDGFDVVLNDIPRNEELLKSATKEIEAKGRKAHIVMGDVTSESLIEELVAKAVEVFGGLDVMVANAGIAVPVQAIHDVVAEDWKRIIDVNLNAVMYCFKHAARQMIKQGRGGRIIGASSIFGKRGSPGYTAYSATKFAVRGLVQSSASDLGKYGITVNAYAPGFIDTPMLRQAADLVRDGTTIREIAVKASPLGVIGQPEDVAAVVSFLVSPQAKFITGQAYGVDGGVHFD